jgi:hypothetical protein
MVKSLGPRGYSIPKSSISEDELIEIQKELTVCPFVSEDYAIVKPQPFKIYQESSSKIYMPKYYGLKKFGLPDVNKLYEGTDIDLKFKGILREEQKEPIKKFYEAVKDPLRMGGILNLRCAFGKCLGKDTPVIMFDGSIKKVQDIKEGDVIMGDDSTARNILSTCTGKEMLYRVNQFKGDSYIVNESHILSLISSINKKYDISVKDYLQSPKSYQDGYYGYRVKIDFPYKNVLVDPYMIGYWCEDNIPIEYIYNSKEIRLKVLAGYIDSNGKKENDMIIILSKCNNDIIYIIRSLGFCIYNKKIYGNEVEQIPILSSKKQIISMPIDTLKMRINIEELSIGDYYGFEIDGNRRFLLGDFTVTHNTTMAINIICELKKKALIIVHKEFLLDQWKERIMQFAPGARIGFIKGPTIDIKNKDIVIGSLQSLSMKEYPEDTFKDFGGVIIDECFPYQQYIVSDKGPICIGNLYNMWKNKEDLPLIKSYNIDRKIFQWKRMTYAWKKQSDKLLELQFTNFAVKCTLNHKILTPHGMIEARKLKIGDLIIGSTNTSSLYKFTIVSIKEIEKWHGGNNSYYSKNVYDIEVSDNHNFVCCGKTSIQGISVQNCHRIGAEVFSRALRKVNFQYALGLSATVKRTDGLSKVFIWNIGDIIFKTKKNIDNVLVMLKEYYNADPEYGREIKNYSNKLNIPQMLNNVCDFYPRTKFTIDILQEVLEDEPDRKVLLLSDRRNHLHEFKKELDKRGITNGFCYGGLKPIIIEESQKQQVILGTYAYASEGLDIPGLNTLILASPKSVLEQIIGRIQRDKPECRKYTPLVIDIIDDFSLFKAQAKKRQKYYKSRQYDIIGEDKPPEVVLNGLCLIKD